MLKLDLQLSVQRRDLLNFSSSGIEKNLLVLLSTPALHCITTGNQKPIIAEKTQIMTE